MENTKCKNCAIYSMKLEKCTPSDKCPFFVQKTNFSIIKAMRVDKLAEYLVKLGWNCENCSENNKRLFEDKCDGQCTKHCKEWLRKEVNDDGEA